MEKRSNKFLWIPVLIFSLEYLGIVGYYWLWGGHLGDASLTISRFVGLNTWSSLLFCAGNLAIAVMLFYYIIVHAKINNFLWKLLMIFFIICFVALSISPHVPDESMPAKIHCFFAGAMFIIMTVISIFTALTTKQKLTSLICLFYIMYGVFFLVCDLFRIDFFMRGILWYESAYIFAFFAVLINSNRLKEQID